MSIKVCYKMKEGIAVESTVVSPGAGLGFGAEIAKIISDEYRTVLEKGPVLHSIKSKVVKGQPHLLAIVLGAVELTEVEWRVYELEGKVDGEAEMDLWLSETPEGHCIMAFNQSDARDHITDGTLPGVTVTLQYAADEIDELLEALGTDLSNEPSQADKVDDSQEEAAE